MLITFEDIRTVRDVAVNLDPARMDPYIVEAENLVIIPAIGVALYEQLLEVAEQERGPEPIDPGPDPVDPEPVEPGPEPIDPERDRLSFILNGGSMDGVRLAGLKAATAYLAYARFAVNNQLNASPLGMRIKGAPYSDDASDGLLFRAANMAERTGEAYLQQVVDYIGAGDSCAPAQRVARRKFKSIG